jgi:hypothetical protein
MGEHVTLRRHGPDVIERIRTTCSAALDMRHVPCIPRHAPFAAAGTLPPVPDKTIAPQAF